jgi:hypothetical protein
MLKPLHLHTPRLRLRPATALDGESLLQSWPEDSLPRWRAQAHGARGAGPKRAGDRLLRRLGVVPGYEADGGRWRVRRYRLPSLSAP